ncbi:hypothetical protein HIM_01337 [Hirsutella minnesotensis 3608]|nr:hypothetical protein HIM_01337 [Hirsutella minnesotensis 3608]
MAPSLTRLLPRQANFDASTASTQLRQQWIHPADVFSVLLILGGDVVGRALSQLAGAGLAPVTFSFGWVAYAASALVSAVGDNKLMPRDPDCTCKVINGKSGFVRDNTSWILGRIVRDYESWLHPATRQRTDEVLDLKWADLQTKKPAAQRPARAGLVVAVYQPSTTRPAGVGERDLVFWSGIVVMLLQLGVAAIPLGLHGDWGVMLVTGAGICLALATGMLPQWAKEKYACRTGSNETYVLTRGNGAQHALVILGNGRGLNLEDLASGQTNVEASANMGTRIAVAALSALWIVLLLTAGGLVAQAWFLLAIGGASGPCKTSSPLAGRGSPRISASLWTMSASTATPRSWTRCLRSRRPIRAWAGACETCSSPGS